MGHSEITNQKLDLPLAGNKSVYNAFVSANMPLVDVDENYVATLSPEEFICSDGVLKKPAVTAALDLESGKLTFTLLEQQLIGLCAKDDDVYAGLYENDQREAVLLQMGKREKETTVEFELPQDWQADHLSIYAFAVSHSQRNASPTLKIELS